VTTRFTVFWSGVCTTGITLTATAAATSTKAATGTLTRLVSRLDTTVTKPTSEVSSTIAPKVSLSLIGLPRSGGELIQRRPDFPARRLTL
jgi:hypothetical protein